MNLLACILVAVLYAAGMYMLVRRSLVKVVIGLVLLGHGTNLLIFTSGGLTKGGPPLVPKDKAERMEFYAAVADGFQGVEPNPGPLPITDPIPPALILTAIVISFAIVSFTIVLMRRAYQELGTDDLKRMTESDRT